MVGKKRGPFTPPDTNLWTILKRTFGLDLFRRGLIRFNGTLEFHGVEITPEMIDALRRLTVQPETKEPEPESAPEPAPEQNAAPVLELDSEPEFELDTPPAAHDRVLAKKGK